MWLPLLMSSTALVKDCAAGDEATLSGWGTGVNMEMDAAGGAVMGTVLGCGLCPWLDRKGIGGGDFRDFWRESLAGSFPVGTPGFKLGG